MRRLARSCQGQAAVEVVALLPLVAAVALAVLQALAAGRAEELAGHAATSGAVALAEGRDGAAAARAAVPDDTAERLRVEVHGSRVHVSLAPTTLIPGAAALLTASAEADAGATP